MTTKKPGEPAQDGGDKKTLTEQPPGKNKAGFKLLIAFLFALSLFVVTHLLEFPGSVGSLMEHNHGKNTFDLEASYSAAETYARLEAFGESGRQLYLRTMLTVDLIFPLSMFTFLFFWAKYATRQWIGNDLARKFIQRLAFAYLILDFLENCFIFFLLSAYPDRLEFIGSYIGFLTIGKRMAMIGSLFIPLLVIIGTKISRLYKSRITGNPATSP